jgi:hypothetical protein
MRSLQTKHGRRTYGLVLPPGHEFEYQQFTSDVTITATVEGSADVIVTADAVIFDGVTTVLIEFFAYGGSLDGGSSELIIVNLFEDGSDIGRLCNVGNPSATGVNAAPLYGALRRTPAAGSRTYSARGWVTIGGGTASVRAGVGGAAARVPGFIRITKV